MNKMQATSLSSQPFQKGIEFMWTQLNMAQRTNPVAEIIGIPNIRLYTAINACGKLLTSILWTAINIQEVRKNTGVDKMLRRQLLWWVLSLPPSLLWYTSLLARADKSVSLLGCQDHIACRVSKQILYNQFFRFNMVHCPPLTIKQHRSNISKFWKNDGFNLLCAQLNIALTVLPVN